MGRKQLNHRRKKRRLRTTQKICPVAVRNMAVLLNEVRKIFDHILYDIPVTAFCKPQHREIRIPIINLPKAATRDDVWKRERDQ